MLRRCRSAAGTFWARHPARRRWGLSGARRRADPGRKDDDPLGVRRDFPAADEVTYLNTAYIGLIPRPVLEAGRAWLDRRVSPFDVGEMLAKADEARRAVAELINASADEIGLLFSTTEGENVVADALELRRGDNVVIDELAYASASVIRKRLEDTRGIEMRVVRRREGGTRVDDFAQLVDGRTRLISVAWVSNLSGFRHDMRGLADLAHAHGAYVYADAIQAIGMGPIDVKSAGVDFLCFGGYKWLMAGFGVAPFYVRHELLDRVRADRVGWRSSGGWATTSISTTRPPRSTSSRVSRSARCINSRRPSRTCAPSGSIASRRTRYL